MAAIAAAIALSLWAPVAAAETNELCVEVTALPEPAPLTELEAKEVELGHRLFFDKALSAPDRVKDEAHRQSCASCHWLDQGGATNRAADERIDGIKTLTNSPGILTSFYNFRQRWDGKTESLEAVIAIPLTNLMNEPMPLQEDPVTHKVKAARVDAAQAAAVEKTWVAVVDRLKDNADYVRQFSDIYGGEIERGGIKKALAAYMKALAKPSSPFDVYCGRVSTKIGQPKMSAEAIEGLRRFRALGCVACHQGQNVGGNMVAPFGVMLVTPEGPFKVPSLRNVAKTAPYFHDGETETLDEAIKTMAEYQLGRVLTDEDVRLIGAFLGSLTSDLEDPLLRDPNVPDGRQDPQ